MIVEKTLKAIKAHAEQCSPMECCGLLVKVENSITYRPCRNLSKTLDHFEMDADDYSDAEDAGEVIAVVHSHVNQPVQPTKLDIASCDFTAVPWLIYGHPSGELCWLQPKETSHDLTGLDYIWGVQDCTTLIERYYRQVLGITPPPYERLEKEFWKVGKCLSEKYREVGFVEVPQGQPIKLHDVFLIRIASKTANHSAVYLGDGIILHHCQDQLSRKATYGESWQKSTLFVMRHKSLC